MTNSTPFLFALCVIWSIDSVYGLEVKEYRFEPFELHQRRMKFNSDYIRKYSNALIGIEYSDNDINENDSGLTKGICIANRDINVNDTIIEYDEDDVISSSQSFPLKSEFVGLLSLSDSLQNNITKKILLSFHLMFELKSNMTLAFIALSKLAKAKGDGNNSKEQQYLDDFRAYLKKRKDNHLLVNYIHNLPLSSRLSHSTWSSDLVSEYLLSGTIAPSTEKVKSFFKGFISQIEKDTLMSQTYSHWLNENEINFFLSIYSFVSSKAFVIENDYYLMPFIDVCRHYHPIRNDNPVSSSSTTAKAIKASRVNTDKAVQLKIVSQSQYAKGTEFTFTYSDDLTNDNLLLNYGLTIANNTHHSYLFQFDLVDPQYVFYKHLLKSNFNMNAIKLNPIDDANDKLSATFSLKLPSLNEELFKFIYHYIEFTSSTNADKEDAVNRQTLQSYLVYYTTIHKNILSITDKMSNGTVHSYIKALSKDMDDIIHYHSQIALMNNNTFQETFEHLYIYNQMHHLLNKRNINIFNLENIRLLTTHQFYLFDDILKMQFDSIQKLKKRYMK